MDNKEDLLGAVEALLFIYGEPLELKKMAKLLGVSEEEAEEAAVRLEGELKESGRGLNLMISERRFQLTTKPQFSPLLAAIVKSELGDSLTPASAETLSLILYGAPVSRAEIDYVRGVNSTFILRNLLIRGAIERSADPKKGNVYLYRPTFEMLKHLGISKADDLPEYERFRTLIKSARNEKEE